MTSHFRRTRVFSDHRPDTRIETRSSPLFKTPNCMSPDGEKKFNPHPRSCVRVDSKTFRLNVKLMFENKLPFKQPCLRYIYGFVLVGQSYRQGCAIAQTPNEPAVSGARIATPVYATLLLSRSAGGALSPIRMKQPGVLLEQLSSWRQA